MSLGENSLVAAYQGRGQLKSRQSGTRVVTFIGARDGGIRSYEIQQERDTRRIRDPTKNCVNEYIVTGVDTISSESETVRITRFNERNISVCSKRLVWRCGAEIKRLWRTQRDFILRNF